MAVLSNLTRRLLRFAARHRWSLPLSVLSTVCFERLASEVREGKLDGIDGAITAGVIEWRGAAFDRLMLTLTTFGSGLVMTLLSALLVGVFVLLKRRREAWFVLVCACGALFLNVGLKLLFQRARPEGNLYVIEPPSSFAFPSGHAMGSTTVLLSALVVAYVVGLPRPFRIVANVFVAILLFGVASSRVYFGVHFPSDVVGGQLAGAAWVSAVTGWFYPRLLPGEHAARS